VTAARHGNSATHAVPAAKGATAKRKSHTRNFRNDRKRASEAGTVAAQVDGRNPTARYKQRKGRDSIAQCSVLAPFLPDREGTMQERRYLTPEHRSEELRRIVATATERARAKNARLRLLKERNQSYLASRRDELDDDVDYVEQEITREL
jgi:hypothetical protein